jgi:hypothetical protein
MSMSRPLSSMKKYRRNEPPHGETTARWFSNDKESSVSGATGFMVVQYSTALMDGEAKLNWKPVDDYAICGSFWKRGCFSSSVEPITGCRHDEGRIRFR